MKQNTKKILSAVVSASILTILVLPLAVSAAQTTPQECCTLKKAISIGEGTTADGLAIAGNVVGAPSATCLDNAGAAKTVNLSTDKWGVYCLINTINIVIDWVFVIMISLAVVLTIFGAFSILTAGGSPEKASTGKNYILYAVVGLAIAFIARAIPGIAKSIMGF